MLKEGSVLSFHKNNTWLNCIKSSSNQHWLLRKQLPPSFHVHPSPIMILCSVFLSDVWYADEAEYAFVSLQVMSRPHYRTINHSSLHVMKTTLLNYGLWRTPVWKPTPSLSRGERCWNKIKADVGFIFKNDGHIAFIILMKDRPLNSPKIGKKNCYFVQYWKQTTTMKTVPKDCFLLWKGDSAQHLTLWNMTWASCSIVNM